MAYGEPFLIVPRKNRKCNDVPALIIFGIILAAALVWGFIAVHHYMNIAEDVAEDGSDTVFHMIARHKGICIGGLFGVLAIGILWLGLLSLVAVPLTWITVVIPPLLLVGVGVYFIVEAGKLQYTPSPPPYGNDDDYVPTTDDDAYDDDPSVSVKIMGYIWIGVGAIYLLVIYCKRRVIHQAGQMLAAASGWVLLSPLMIGVSMALQILGTCVLVILGAFMLAGIVSEVNNEMTYNSFRMYQGLVTGAMLWLFFIVLQIKTAITGTVIATRYFYGPESDNAEHRPKDPTVNALKWNTTLALGTHTVSAGLVVIVRQVKRMTRNRGRWNPLCCLIRLALSCLLNILHEYLPIFIGLSGAPFLSGAKQLVSLMNTRFVVNGFITHRVVRRVLFTFAWITSLAVGMLMWWSISEDEPMNPKTHYHVGSPNDFTHSACSSSSCRTSVMLGLVLLMGLGCAMGIWTVLLSVILARYVPDAFTYDDDDGTPHTESVNLNTILPYWAGIIMGAVTFLTLSGLALTLIDSVDAIFLAKRIDKKFGRVSPGASIFDGPDGPTRAIMAPTGAAGTTSRGKRVSDMQQPLIAQQHQQPVAVNMTPVAPQYPGAPPPGYGHPAQPYGGPPQPYTTTPQQPQYYAQAPPPQQHTPYGANPAAGPYAQPQAPPAYGQAPPAYGQAPPASAPTADVKFDVAPAASFCPTCGTQLKATDVSSCPNGHRF